MAIINTENSFGHRYPRASLPHPRIVAGVIQQLTKLAVVVRSRALHPLQAQRTLQGNPLYSITIVVSEAPRALNLEESLLLHVSDASIHGQGRAQDPYKMCTGLQAVRSIGGMKISFAENTGNETVAGVDLRMSSVDLVTAMEDSVNANNGRVITAMMTVLVGG